MSKLIESRITVKTIGERVMLRVEKDEHGTLESFILSNRDALALAQMLNVAA
jgi:hypothetical protein